MPKVNRGGKRTATITQAAAAPSPVSETPPEINAQGQITPTANQQDALTFGDVDYQQFLQMTEDQKADAIADALKQDLPAFLDDSAIQKVAYYCGVNQLPDVVPDSQLDSLPGKDIFRTVHSTYNPNTDVGYSAQEICDQTRYGIATMYADAGGTAHGKGIYFADTYGSSAVYRSGVKPNLMMRAKYKPGTKLINESAASSGAQNEIRKGSKLGNVLAKCDTKSRMAVYAICKGYDGIYDKGTGYNMVLNRGCLVMSDTVKKPIVGGRW